MPYLNDVQKPTEQLADLLSGKVRWKDAPASIRSWARFFVYQGATEILAIKGKDARKRALLKVPASVRPMVEAEALRLWRDRR